MTEGSRHSASATMTRRNLLRGAGGAAVLATLPWGQSLWNPGQALGSSVRQPDSLPDPTRPAGTATTALPFDHIVIVMMENHSFDNLLG
ncbi:MAG: Phosphoesterase family, partial [Solirubrobacterales bacterium]|nr:Phosphoesterase family [Solirubrobacterales bacterium]